MTNRGSRPETAGRAKILSMSDMLMVTLGLFGSVMACLARPCGPDQWALVKAARPEDSSIPASTRRIAPAVERSEAPVFVNAFAHLAR